MNKNFTIFQKEATGVTDSFANAIAAVAKAKRSNRDVITQALEASLANSLSAMASSLANSVGAIGEASFANNLGKMRKRLKAQAKLLVKAGSIG